MATRVLVWNENVHERLNPLVAETYPHGIHGALKNGIEVDGAVAVETATLDDPEHGLTAERLARTDVLIWWAHKAHHMIEDAIVDRVQRRVWEGMGLIVLHSGHFSKIFRRLLGTPCTLKWREAGEVERLWVLNPGHPITAGLPEYIEIDHEEMYGEPFAIPEPLETLLISAFEGGEVFRSGVTYQRGAGRIFYFRPGHEMYPTYYHPQVLTVIRNAVRWAHNPVLPWSSIDDAPHVPADKAPVPLVVKGPTLHKPGEAGLR